MCWGATQTYEFGQDVGSSEKAVDNTRFAGCQNPRLGGKNADGVYRSRFLGRVLNLNRSSNQLYDGHMQGANHSDALINGGVN